MEKDDRLGGCSFFDRDLASFFNQKAYQYQNQQLAKTFVALIDEEIVGYITVSLSSVDGKNIKHIDDVECPSLLVGRLAIDESYQRKGIGRALMDLANFWANEISKIVVCRFILVHSRPDAVGFYEKCGFEVLKEEEGKPITMIFDLLKTK